METSTLTAVLLPLALGVIMLGLGLSLTVADFLRVLTFPRAVLVGLLCQMVLLPGVCFVIAKYSGLSPELAVGLMLLSASPGGVTANLYSHLAVPPAVYSIIMFFTAALFGWGVNASRCPQAASPTGTASGS